MNARTETMAFILLEQPVAYLGEKRSSTQDPEVCDENREAGKK
jgi:hypothetical protein